MMHKELAESQQQAGAGGMALTPAVSPVGLLKTADAVAARHLEQLGLRKAAVGFGTEQRLGSGHPDIDRFLGGGLPVGALTEWGAPLGQGGRDLVLLWLAKACSPSGRTALPAAWGHTAPWILWAHSWPHLSIYPPAWQARGVRLEQLRCVCTPAPVTDLRPVFLEPVFRLIILDAPQRFSAEDCAFVARQARLNDQVVIVLRDSLLGVPPPTRGGAGEQGGGGGIWARLRLNTSYDHGSQCYRLQAVRGLPAGVLTLPSAPGGLSLQSRREDL